MNSTITLVYNIALHLFLTGFSVYDTAKHRVPNRALLLFLPVTLLAPLVFRTTPGEVIAVNSILGAAAGFLILLAAALLSKNNDGIGGGDIKLTAMLGFIFGLADILAILVIATLLVIPICLFCKRPVAFVPFLYIGVLVTTVIRLIN